jgi:hypothetical protein
MTTLFLQKNFTRLLSVIFGVMAFFSMASADSFSVITAGMDALPGTMVVRYRIEQPPTQSIKLYSWIGEYGAPQMTGWRTNVLVQSITKTSSMPRNFTASFNFDQLGFVSGKVYAFTLANQNNHDGNELYFNDMGMFTCFTLDAQKTPTQVNCDAASTPAPAPTTPPVTSIPNPGTTCTDPGCKELFKTEDVTINATESQATIHATLISQDPSITEAKVKIFMGESENALSDYGIVYQGVANAQGIGFTANVQALKPQTRYYVTFKEITTGTVLFHKDFTTLVAFAGPGGGPLGQGIELNPLIVGGATIAFPSQDQKLSKTTADFRGVVSVTVPMDVELSYLFAPAGEPFNQEQQVLNKIRMVPGVNQTININLQGLTEGTRYQFVIKNKTANKLSSPIEFVTPGGTTNETALFAGNRIGGNLASESFTSLADDVSDKGIVPKCGRTPGPNVPESETYPCTINNFFELIGNVIKYGLIILGPIVALIVIYSGITILVLSGSNDPTGNIKNRIKSEKARLVKIALGVAIILSAYLIFATIIRELGVKASFHMLDIFN